MSALEGNKNAGGNQYCKKARTPKRSLEQKDTRSARAGRYGGHYAAPGAAEEHAPVGQACDCARNQGEGFGRAVS
jgi:hypothetical protein